MKLYSAQFASSPNLFTDLNLINTSSVTRQVRWSAFAADGTQLVQTATLDLQGGRQLIRDASELFPQAGQGGVFEGTLRVEADAEGVLGGVIFGDRANLEYAAALPLQGQLFREAVFSQVANVAGFFAGLALHFPEPEGPGPAGMEASSTVELQVYSADGQLVGSSTLELAGNQRVSSLVEQLVPASAGQAGGYVLMRASRPMIGQMLFGAISDGRIGLLSAVPPAVIE